MVLGHQSMGRQVAATCCLAIDQRAAVWCDGECAGNVVLSEESDAVVWAPLHAAAGSC